MASISSTPARLWWLAFAVVAAILVAPLTLTEIPPLLDYPNHLARMEILTHGGDPVLSRLYRIEWRILPNIAIDATMPMLMKIMPLALAGKIFLGAALLLPLLGIAALHRALFRVRSLWPLAAGLVAYNRLFFAGFMNFLIGMGLALLAAALWEARKGGKATPRIAAASIIAIVIFFCHLIALAFYGVLLASLEVARAWKRRRIDPGRVVGLAIPFVIPALLYFNAPLAKGAPDEAHGLIAILRQYYWQLAGEPDGLKLYGLMGPFLTYSRLLDAAAVLLALGLLAILHFRKRLTIAWAPIGLMAALLIVYPFVPFTLLATGWIDQRLPILAGFLLFAGTLPGVLSTRTARLMAAAIAATLIARTAEIGQVWAGRDAQLAEFRQIIAPVGPGERVMVMAAEDGAAPGAMVNQPDSVRSMLYNDATMHLAGLLVIEHKAFWPLLFTAAGKQPVEVLPPYAAIALPEGILPWTGALAAPRAWDLNRAPYLASWRENFDWVLVLWPGLAPNGYDLLPDLLQPVTAGKVAALYRIRK
jgi:hypothetical protein